MYPSDKTFVRDCTLLGKKNGQAQNGKILIVLTTKRRSETDQKLNKRHPETSCATICWFTFAALYGEKVETGKFHLFSLLVRKGTIMIMMKMFDEKFKLTHVWVYKIFRKYLLGCFFFLKDY